MEVEDDCLLLIAEFTELGLPGTSDNGWLNGSVAEDTLVDAILQGHCNEAFLFSVRFHRERRRKLDEIHAVERCPEQLIRQSLVVYPFRMSVCRFWNGVDA